MEHLIKDIEKGSIAEELGIQAGDTLLSINNRPVEDILDYKELMADEALLLLVQKQDGLYEYDVEKEAGEDVGLVFSRATLDPIRQCRNKCIFCFIDQLPREMRDSLYLKDDDYRLSLLHGNYISLTNLSPSDVKRIISRRISPLYISIHTTDKMLRHKMMGNLRASKILETLNTLKAGGIYFHGQIVLCPGINDGVHLDKTLQDLAALSPHVLSLSLVPVGLTRHRQGLYPLRGYTRPESLEILEQCGRWQETFKEREGRRVVHAADEFYLSAGVPVPPEPEYEGYPQLENGVGMIRLFQEEYRKNRGRLPRSLPAKTRVSMACGLSAYQALSPLQEDLSALENLTARLFPVENRFFGGGVTVTGLLTGSDLLAGLKDQPLGDCLYISRVMLKDEGDLFLDGLTVAQVQEALQVKVIPVAHVGHLIDEISALAGQSGKGVR